MAKLDISGERQEQYARHKRASEIASDLRKPSDCALLSRMLCA